MNGFVDTLVRAVGVVAAVPFRVWGTGHRGSVTGDRKHRSLIPDPRSLLTRPLLTITAAVAFALPLIAQDVPNAASDQSVKDVDSAVERLARQVLPELQMRTAATGDPLKTVEVSTWSNPTRSSSRFGKTILFVANGRPEAVSDLYTWNGNLVFEFGSLSRSPLILKRDGETLWTPREPGVEFQPIPRAETPHKSRTVRLLQMKKLARRFSGIMLGWRSDDADREELRPLARPTFRYEQEAGEVLDGAMFDFVMGVDPEATLLIEAVSTTDGPQWQYAWRRRSSAEVAGRLDGVRVWHVRQQPARSADPTKTFFGYGLPVEDAP